MAEGDGDGDSSYRRVKQTTEDSFAIVCIELKIQISKYVSVGISENVEIKEYRR